DGVIQQVASPEEIYDQPCNTFVAGFIGSPPMNFIEGLLEETGDELKFKTRRFTIAVPDDKAAALRKAGSGRYVLLGIRPENLSVEHDALETSPDASMQGTLRVSELMGADRYLHLDIGQKQLLVVRANPRRAYDENMMVKVALD